MKRSNMQKDGDYSKKKKLLFFISSLSGGGAERVMALLCNGFSKEYEVCLATYQDPKNDTYELKNTIKRYDLSHSPCASTRKFFMRLHAYKHLFKFARNLRRIIKSEKPNCCISFTTFFNTILLMSSRGLKTKIIISERAPPTHEKPSLPWRLLRNVFYPFTDKLVIQTAALEAWAERITKNKNKISIIKNPVNPSIHILKNQKPETPDRPFILSVARLSHEKGIDILINAYAEIANKSPYDLIILGEGNQRHELEELIAKHQLLDSIHLIGFKKYVYDYIRKAQFIVLSSRYEGFPNILIEAVTLGKPIISTDCDFGPRAIIQNNQTGLLVPPDDVKALASAMLNYINNAELAKKHACEGLKKAHNYELNSICEKWQEIF